MSLIELSYSDNLASPLASPKQTRLVLEHFNLAAKKRFGQNFLINDAIIRKIINLAEVGSQESILEVGPGIGTLSLALLKNASQLISVEYDSDLLEVLVTTCKPYEDRFALIYKDALKLTEEDIRSLCKPESLPTKLVSNLPYAVAATLILDYFERFEWLSEATVMVQSEVADRIAATLGSKNYGAYTVKLSLFAEVEGRFFVSPNNFMPPPRVDSSVIKLKRINLGIEPALLPYITRIVDASFASRRKTIYNSIKSFFASGTDKPNCLSDEEIVGLLSDAKIDSKRRGETLAKEEFITLGTKYYELIAQRL